MFYVQFNAPRLHKKRREEKCGASVLLAMEASKAQTWINDGGDNEENDEEVYSASGLMWRMVKDETRADKVLESRRK